MHQRKLPLVIHIDPVYLVSLNKTCCCCPRYDLLIAHQNDDGCGTLAVLEAATEEYQNEWENLDNSEGLCR